MLIDPSELVLDHHLDHVPLMFRAPCMYRSWPHASATHVLDESALQNVTKKDTVAAT